MDKRKFRRLTTQIDVFFSIAQSGIHSGWLLDYGKGGALVAFKQPQQQAQVADPAALNGRAIQIHFTLDDKEFLLDGNVVHVGARGIGIKFTELDAMAFAALVECARRRANSNPASSTVSPDRRVIDRDLCRQRVEAMTQSFVTEFSEEFIDRFSNRLLYWAEQAIPEIEPQACLDALSSLNFLRRSLVAKITMVYGEQLSQFFVPTAKDDAPVQQPMQRTLSLVEKADFEEWLLVKVATSRSELALRQVMSELLVRLECCAGHAVAEEGHPLSPGALFRACNAELREHNLKDNVIRLLFRSLVDYVIERFSAFYDELNQTLVQLGVLPELSIGQYRRSVPQETSPTNKVVSRIAESVSPPSREVAAKQDSPNPFSVDEKMARDAFITANRLLGMQRQMHAGAQRSPSTATLLPSVEDQPDQRDEPTVDAQNLSTEELFKALNRVCNELSAVAVPELPILQDALPTHVMERLKDLNVDYPEAFRDAITMMGSLVANIADEQRMSGDLREAFCKIQIPLAALQVADPDIFVSDQHPVRELLNYLALLAEPESANFKNNAETVKAVIQRLMASDPLDERAVGRILQDIRKQIDREKSIIERNIQRVVESCDGRQRILQSNEFLHRQLDSRVADRQVPRTLMRLLDGGWKELMRLSLLRDGPGSRSWNTSLQVVDDLLVYLGERPCPEDGFHFPLETLLKIIEKGLQKVSNTTDDSQALVGALRAAAMAPAVDWVEGRQYSVKSPEVDLPSQFPPRLCKKVQRLKVGQWMEYGIKSQKKSLCQIAWISQHRDKFALVNPQGMRVAELTMEQLVARLNDGDIQLLSDGQASAVEKGLDALIQKIYEKIAYETSHDQLTGLLSRKEFEKALAQSVARARRQQGRYALVYLDLLQFKLINNLCGYEGGDHLLQQVATAITELAFAGQVVGRIGGNEFAVIFPVDTDTDAYRYACRIKSAIESQRFNWGKSTHSLMTSVSLCTFDHQTNQVLELLRTVEAATQIAKSSGLKEVQMVKQGDSRFVERDSLMSWVAKISDALENGHLRLRCQKIAPAAELHPDWLPHYEILLTVVDEAGVHIPPVEFIKAAESYGRMADVDRWVITQVLTWMKQNERHLNAFGGFSINLSGHTLNDDRFLDFIFEQLVRFDVPRNKVIFEITETTAVSNLEEAADFIAEMKEIGCRFSLDDFGTGQSSYAYLKKLPVDFIKIDGAFIRKIESDKVDYALVKSITEMGHYLDKHIVAEFVSDQAKYDTVVSLGVDYVQGYHLGKPIMLDSLIDEEFSNHAAHLRKNGGL